VPLTIPATVPSTATTTAITTTIPVTTTMATVSTSSTPAFRFFSPLGIWNQPLAASALIDPNSAAISDRLMSFINTSVANRTGPWINTASYSTPIYTVPANQPTVPVIMDYNNPLAPAMGAVPIPSNALPAAGTDAEATFYQPSSDTLWEMWKLRQRLNPPPYVSASMGTGGSLPAGTYYYAVTALTPTGETTASAVKSYTVAAGATVGLSWGGPVGATAYRIYRGTSPTSLQLVESLAHVTTQQGDSGCAGPGDDVVRGEVDARMSSGAVGLTWGRCPPMHRACCSDRAVARQRLWCRFWFSARPWRPRLSPSHPGRDPVIHRGVTRATRCAAGTVPR
jgi:hypothetical protein